MVELRLLSRAQMAGMPIHSSPALQPQEKETCLNLLGGEKELSVMTYHPTAIRGFLRQPEFQPTKAYIERIDGRDTIIGIEGVIPFSCLHIGAARKRNYLSAVFARRSGMRKHVDCALETQDQAHQSKTHGGGASDETTKRVDDSRPPDCVRTNE